MIKKLYTDLSRPANLIPTYKTALTFDPGIFLAPIIQFQQVSQKTHFFGFSSLEVEKMDLLVDWSKLPSLVSAF
jgi:hypothetical protein